MSKVQANFLYTKEHEWVEQLSETSVRVGITDFAQNLLGDIVFLELPKVGDELTAEQSFGTMESVKTVSDIFSPISGTVSKLNESLEASPNVVNGSPYTEGWMIEVTISGPDALVGLLTAAQYKDLIGESND
ncbi:Glycine cleavage system H protein [compost metagenome]